MIAAVRIALPSVNLPENLSRQPRHGAWVLLIVAAAAYYPRFVKLPAGMETYPQAAACLWHGQVLQVCDPGFTYPPFFALVMLPFVPMPLWLRDLVWYGVTLAATLGVFKLSEHIAVRSLAAPLTRTELLWLRLFALLLSAKLVLAVFENQAYDALVLVAVLLGLAALGEERPVTAGSISIVIRLVRPVHRNTDIIRLLVGQLGQLHPDLVEMQPRHLFVELLWQRVDLVLILVGIGPQLDLRQRLVGEG